MRQDYIPHNIDGEIDLSFLKGKIKGFAENPIDGDIRPKSFHSLLDFLNELDHNSIVYYVYETKVNLVDESKNQTAQFTQFIARYQK